MENNFQKIKNINSNISLEKFVLITGASSGIGYAFAVQAAKSKKNLILVALKNSGLDKVSVDIKNNYGVLVYYYEIDLTINSACDEIFDFCKSKNIKVNMLINNAGIGNQGRFDSIKLHYSETMMLLNMQTIVKMTYRFLEQLPGHDNQAYILNISSMAGLIPVPFKSIYSASKKFIYTFSDTLVLELKSRNVHVSCVCPGPVATNERIINLIKRQGWLAKLFISTAEKVAEYSWRKLHQHKQLIIPGRANRIIYFISFFIPKRIKNYIIKKYIFKKYIAFSADIDSCNLDQTANRKYVST